MGEDLGFELLPGERIVRVEDLDIVYPKELMPSVEALQKLVGASSEMEIGTVFRKVGRHSVLLPSALLDIL